MDVQPKILEQEKIELPINFTVSVTTGSSPPVVTSNTVSTNLVVKSKESAAIGGVVQSKSTTDYDNTGDDPAPVQVGGDGGGGSPLFRLFRSKNYKTDKTQFVIFVTPEIIESASAGTEEIRKKFRRRE